MKRFRFKLARLSRVRKVQEELALAAWQTAERAASEAQERIELADQAIANGVAELRLIQNQGNIDPRQVLQARGALEHMEQRRVLLVRVAESARVEALRLREPWQALRTELEGLRRLEQKERTKFRIESEREDAKQIDEQTMDRSGRPNFQLRRKRA